MWMGGKSCRPQARVTLYNLVCRVPTSNDRIKKQPTITWVVNVEGRKAKQTAADGSPEQAVVRTQNTT